MYNFKHEITLKKTARFLPLFILGFVFLLSACGEDEQESSGGKPKKAKKMIKSKGGFAEIVVIMDPRKKNAPLGEALKDIFAKDIPGLPQPESWFKLLTVPPSKFSGTLKRHHNIIFLTSLDNDTNEGRYLKGFFTKKSLEMIKNNPKRFMLRRKNVYAQGQRIMYLFGNTEEQLMKNMEANKEVLLNYFHDREQKRLTDKLYGISEQQKLSEYIQKVVKLKMRIPSGFGLAKKQKNFVWLRKKGNPAQKLADINLIIASRPYTSTKIFEEENIVAWRDTLGKHYINDESREGSYVTTETMVKPILDIKKITIDKKFAVEYRGFWKLANGSRGGPFLSYAFVDEAQKRVFYIEGFIYAAGMRKKEAIFRTEAILKTFERLK